MTIHLVISLVSELFTGEGFRWTFCRLSHWGKLEHKEEKVRFLLRENSSSLYFRITVWNNEKKKKKTVSTRTNYFPVLGSSCFVAKNKNMFGLKHIESRWRAPVLSRGVIKNSASSSRSTGVRSAGPKVLILTYFQPLPFVIHYNSRVSADCCYLSPFSRWWPPQRWRQAVGGGQQIHSLYMRHGVSEGSCLFFNPVDIFIYIFVFSVQHHVDQMAPIWTSWLFLFFFLNKVCFSKEREKSSLLVSVFLRFLECLSMLSIHTFILLNYELHLSWYQRSQQPREEPDCCSDGH